MKRDIQIFENPQTLADQFSTFLMNLIASVSGERFNLAISGGTTPNLLYSALATKYSNSVLWQKTHFWWVDERLVSSNDPESNFGNAERLLFSKISIPSQNIHPIRGESDPFTEVINYQGQIAKELDFQNGSPVFDLILLGMGEDGHTASIFPDQINLLESGRLCEIAIHPVSHQKRITMTGRLINNASQICFLVTGANKAERLFEILSDDKKGKLLPAIYIRPVNGELSWFCDEAAANLLH